jgi:hypothetical protein
MTDGGNIPNAWVILGSRDGVNWNALDFQNGITSGFIASTYRNFIVNSVSTVPYNRVSHGHLWRQVRSAGLFFVWIERAGVRGVEHGYRGEHGSVLELRAVCGGGVCVLSGRYQTRHRVSRRYGTVVFAQFNLGVYVRGMDLSDGHTRHDPYYIFTFSDDFTRLRLVVVYRNRY